MKNQSIGKHPQTYTHTHTHPHTHTNTSHTRRTDEDAAEAMMLDAQSVSQSVSQSVYCARKDAYCRPPASFLSGSLSVGESGRQNISQTDSQSGSQGIIRSVSQSVSQSASQVRQSFSCSRPASFLSWSLSVRESGSQAGKISVRQSVSPGVRE